MPPQQFNFSEDNKFLKFCEMGALGADITDAQVRNMIEWARHIFRQAMKSQGRDNKKITALLTKFCDAGRRSPPTTAFSSIVPGRPQNGADGNRTKRWLLPGGSKYYATEVTATLVEIKYILQALSMDGGPEFPEGTIQHSYEWLVGHAVEPGRYLDPIQLTPISLDEFFDNPRGIQSGHVFPLDRGGRHEPNNTFLMLHRSNQIQGNSTIPELLSIMEDMVEKHKKIPNEFSNICGDN